MMRVFVILALFAHGTWAHAGNGLEDPGRAPIGSVETRVLL